MWVTLVDTKQKYLRETQRKITEAGMANCNATLLPVDTVIFSSRATIGEVTISKVETCTNQGFKNFVCNKKRILPEYLFYILRREAASMRDLCAGMTYPEISKAKIAAYKIPVPDDVTMQQRIVDEIEAENLPHYELKELERAASKQQKFRTERDQTVFAANEKTEAILKRHLEN